MIPIKHTIERDHNLTRSAWKGISKIGWQAAGETWHAEILPRKFTNQASYVYGYQRRTARYTQRKIKKLGHRRPLEYTGELKRQVIRIRDVRVTGDSSKRQGAARVVLRGPRYLYAYRKDLKQPDKAAELQAISSADASLIAARMDKVITDALNGRSRSKERIL